MLEKETEIIKCHVFGFVLECFKNAFVGQYHIFGVSGSVWKVSKKELVENIKFLVWFQEVSTIDLVVFCCMWKLAQEQSDVRRRVDQKVTFLARLGWVSKKQVVENWEVPKRELVVL